MGVDLVRPSIHPPKMHDLLNVEKVRIYCIFVVMLASKKKDFRRIASELRILNLKNKRISKLLRNTGEILEEISIKIQSICRS
jgi:hypothetical protein